MTNNLSLPDGESEPSSKDAFTSQNNTENAPKDNEKKIPAKAVKKKDVKVIPEQVKEEKPATASPKKAAAKKTDPKKVIDEKTEAAGPKPARTKVISAAIKQTPADTKMPSADKTLQSAKPVKKVTEKKAATSTKKPGNEAANTQLPAPVDVPADLNENGAIPTEAPIETLEKTATEEDGKSEERDVLQPGETIDEVDRTANAKPVASASYPLHKITFQIKFHTKMGQSLYVSGNHDLLGNNDYQHAFPLTYLNPEYWVASLEIPVGEIATDISYRYLLKNEDDTLTAEWGEDKIIETGSLQTEELVLIDSWNSSTIMENTFFTEPFQEVLLKDNFTEIKSSEPQTITHVFRVKAPLLQKDQAICIVGSAAGLGKWNAENPLLLSAKQGAVWNTISLDLSHANFPVSYKYGLYDIKNAALLHIEEGNNRTLYNSYSPGKITITSDGFARLPYKNFKGAGVAIPVFSLRSENSFGAGEFTDLKLMIDWAKQTGLKLVQLLPVNDTTATHSFADSYPYAAISAFALHPLYLHLPAIVSEDEPLLNTLKEKQAELNSKAEVDYVAVMKAKWDFLKQVFPSQKETVFANADFQAFFLENEHWLVPYAAFSYLREQNNTSEFSKWTSHQSYNKQAINELASSPAEANDEISIYYFVQYHLHLQLKDAADYAHENGIVVKGDIPIGIYRNSCDAWQEPELFNMNMQAGAPPDDFAIKGQNWGFPTYNWQRMRKDGFSWWKKRFHQMSYYFDAFRIDHILGFFRIWSIPVESVQGIMGHFVPAIPVHITELTGRGAAFSRERFCKPYIVDGILADVFGAEAESVKANYLTQSAGLYYTLQPAFDTQRKVEEHFSSLEKTPANNQIKEGLFDLLSNVIMFEADGTEGQQFHFRIAMQNTSSYRHLDGHTKYVLYDLYENYFFRRQDDFWMKEAMMKLPELKRSTNMLICGEDLGMVPASVPGVMRELSILSLEIQRMPKDPSREFFHPNDAPYLSVVTPSTHDMSTVRGWWEEDRAATQRFFNSQLGQWGTAPYFCEPWINKIILMQHLYSPAMWSIFQLQDLLGISGALRRENPNEERINIPADPHHYWRYRMHLTLEDLIGHTGFSQEVRNYVSQSGR